MICECVDGGVDVCVWLGECVCGGGGVGGSLTGVDG